MREGGWVLWVTSGLNKLLYYLEYVFFSTSNFVGLQLYDKSSSFNIHLPLNQNVT